MLRFGWLLSAKEGKTPETIEGVPLENDVEILQDELGIPHIFASSEIDIATAQGYVHARDRLWQIESGYRAVTGRLSEAVGERMVDLDHFAILAGFDALRRRAVSAMSPENRRFVEAYARGLNAYIDLAGRRVALEYRRLGLVPHRWTADDLCAVLPLNAWFLQTNYHQELVALLSRGSLDSDAFAELYPSGPGAELPFERFFKEYGDTRIGPLIPAALAFYPEFGGAGGGSNSWVSRSGEGGLPVLANDPHLGVIVPQIWHICHLCCPAFNVAGVSMPGVPGIILGRNEKVAWGVTNLMTDIVDLAMVRIDPAHPTRYRVGDSWREMAVDRVEIPVRNRTPVIRKIYRTVFGPLITETGAGTDAAAALVWYGTLPEKPVASVPGLPPDIVTAGSFVDTTIDGFMSMFRASTVEDIIAAGSLLKTVGQNLVCGDVNGNIAWHATGLVPVRKGHSGRTPADASSATEYWKGFIPYAALPSDRNPSAGFIATANNRPVPDESPHPVTYSWAAPYRRERIAQSIRRIGGNPTVEDFQEIQRDTHVTQADHLLPSVFAFSYSNPKSIRAIRVLKRWDRRASRDSAGALLFTIFLVELNRLLAGATLKGALPVYLALSPPLYSAADKALETGCAPRLLAAAGFASDDLGAACEKALARSFDIAVETCGKNPARWRLGRLHTYLFAYSGATNYVAKWLLNRGPYPAPGTSTTVNVSIMNPANARPGSGSVATAAGTVRGKLGRRQAEYRAVAVASMRFTASLADPDRTFIMAPMGQSGRPGNLHYDDMIQKWIECEVVRLPLSRSGAESVARERFTLRADSGSAR